MDKKRKRDNEILNIFCNNNTLNEIEKIEDYNNNIINQLINDDNEIKEHINNQLEFEKKYNVKFNIKF